MRCYEPLFIRIKESEALNNLFFKGFILEYGESYEEFSEIYLFVTVCIEHSKHVLNYHGIGDSVAHFIADSNNYTKFIVVYHAVIAFETGDLLEIVIQITNFLFIKLSRLLEFNKLILHQNILRAICVSHLIYLWF